MTFSSDPVTEMHYEYGMIHGRFQPFHLEHLRYFRLAWGQCDQVFIGITNPDPSTVVADPLSSHRHLPEENPFTFTERLMMIQAVLHEEGYPLERVLIIPFPIHHPERWPYYVPVETVMFVVSYSPWEQQKAEHLRRSGFRVVEETGLSKGISSREIRSLINSGGRWEHLVPPAVARFIRARLKGHT
jgi:nicotinamide mononucleotide adenylyltransferase